MPLAQLPPSALAELRVRGGIGRLSCPASQVAPRRNVFRQERQVTESTGCVVSHLATFYIGIYSQGQRQYCHRTGRNCAVGQTASAKPQAKRNAKLAAAQEAPLRGEIPPGGRIRSGALTALAPVTISRRAKGFAGRAASRELGRTAELQSLLARFGTRPAPTRPQAGGANLPAGEFVVPPTKAILPGAAGSFFLAADRPGAGGADYMPPV